MATVTIPKAWIPTLHRENDAMLMDIFETAKPRTAMLDHLNRVCLYLGATMQGMPGSGTQHLGQIKPNHPSTAGKSGNNVSTKNLASGQLITHCFSKILILIKTPVCCM
eukprot:3739818-Ditylum_brightwellii.AAC.1